MDEQLLRKLAGVPIREADEKQVSPKEKIKYFERMIQDVWGVKTKVTTEGEDIKKGKGRYKIVAFSPKNVELGFTTLDVGGSFGDSLFGSANGMFLTQAGQEEMKHIRKNYKDKFPGSRA